MNAVLKTLTKITAKPTFIIKKHSPAILVVVGVGSVVGAAVLACRATLKAQKVLKEEYPESIETCEKAKNNYPEGSYSEEDYQEDLTLVKIQTGFKIAKLYVLPVTLGVAGIGCIVGGHKVLTKRNIALTAAYKAIEEGFNSYRQRVKDELGEDTDYAYKHGLKKEEVTVVETDEDGKTKKVKKTSLAVDDPNKISQYARFFDETSTEWVRNAEMNMVKIKSVQNYFNDILKIKGHVFLNEVYDSLGMQRSQAGQIVGWIASKNGDGYIDFGIYKSPEFVNGLEKSILLDFNVDGVIYDFLPKERPGKR